MENSMVSQFIQARVPDPPGMKPAMREARDRPDAIAAGASSPAWDLNGRAGRRRAKPGVTWKGVAKIRWVQEFRDDIRRFERYQRGASALVLVGMHQGLWAMLQYRIAHAIYRSSMPGIVKQPLLVLAVVWQKLVEVTTGISIKYRTRIGTGFYIGHFGNIFLGPDVVIGPMCNISQGVTIGVSGRGERRGYPTLGERVYVGANAIIAGKLTIGDGAVIGANSLVTQDVPPNAVVVGSPLKIISYKGSAAYLDPEAGTGS